MKSIFKSLPKRTFPSNFTIAITISNNLKRGQVYFWLEQLLQIGTNLLQIVTALYIPNRCNGCHESGQT